MIINMSSKSANIFTGICIKRYPYLIKPLNTLEAKMDEYNRKFEFEKSVLSDFEIRKLKEDEAQRTFMEASSKDKDNIKLDADIVTTKEKLNTWTTNHQQLNFENQPKHYSDKLQIFIVNQKLSKEEPYQWFLPIFKFENNFKSLKQQAESQITSTSIKISNLPSYCYKYKHQTHQMKIFFLNAHVQRNVSLINEDIIRCNDNISNATWVTLAELTKYITNPKLLKTICAFVKEF